MNKSKQSAESKQTADVIKIHKFSYTTYLYCVSESISDSMAKSKQSAKSKQTADLLKNPYFSYPTTLYSINEAISASTLLYLTNLAGRRRKKPNMIY